MVLFRAWPTWSTPVTLGGGMTMEKEGLDSSMVAWKFFCSSHF
jgi:hypothetical protein